MENVKIKTKFNVGDTVFVTGCVYNEHSPCEGCRGKKYIILANMSYTCPACQGSGIRYANPRWQIVSQATIKAIFVEVNPERLSDSEPSIYYYVSPPVSQTNGPIKNQVQFFERSLFSTPNEASEDCDRRNTVLDAEK
jgi:hypothetical protein